MLQYAKILLAYYLISLVTGLALLVALRRHNRAVIEKRKTANARALNKAVMGWMIAQPFVSYLLLVFAPSGGLGYDAALTRLLIPSVAISALFRLGVSWAIAPLGYWNNRGDLWRMLRGHLLLAAIWTSVAFVVFHMIYRESLLIPLVAVVATVGLILLTSRRGARLAKGVAMDESLPLRAETDRLLEGFGVRGRPLVVRPFAADGRTATDVDLAVIVLGWMRKMNPNRPWIPMAVLQSTEPESAVAMLAFALAGKRAWKPGRAALLVSYIDRLLIGTYVIIVQLAVALLLGLGRMTNAAVGMLTTVAIVGSGLLVVRGALALWLRRSLLQKQMDAYRAWRESAPDSTRNHIGFLEGHLAYLHLAVPSAKPDALLNMLFQQPSILDLLKELRIDPETARAELQTRAAEAQAPTELTPRPAPPAPVPP